MQEIVAFCDNHVERDGVRVPGEGYRIGLSGVWKRIDLCHPCVVDLLGPLESTLKAHGREVSEVFVVAEAAPKVRSKINYSDEAWDARLKRMGKARQCLWCPEIVEGGYTKLRDHLYSRHGFETFEKAYGYTCPICGGEDIARLSGHIGRAHLCNLAEAFEWAFYGDDTFARALAERRRALGVGVSEPAQTEDTLHKVDAAKTSWMALHG